MNPSQLRIVPVTEAVTGKLKDRQDYIDVPGSTPEVGDRNAENVIKDIAVVGSCDRFDLSSESDRAKYADLSAKLFAGTECVRLWEEKTQQNGSLIVYVSYISYTNVYQSSARTINLKD